MLKRRAAWGFVLAGLGLLGALAGLRLRARPEAIRPKAAQRDELPPGSMARRAVAGRWLKTEEITSNPELRQEIDALAREPVAAGTDPGFAACGYSIEQARASMTEGQRALAARFQRLEERLSPSQLRAIAFHEAPVLRVRFVAKADWPDDELDRLASLLADGGQAEVPLMEPLNAQIQVANEAAGALCLAGASRQNEDTLAWLTALERALADPALVRGKHQLVTCLAWRRYASHMSLLPVLQRLLQSEDADVLTPACELLENRKFLGGMLANSSGHPPEIAGFIERMGALLAHPRSEVRMSALLALLRMQPDPKARAAAVERLLSDPDRRVREVAVRAYGSQDWDRAKMLALLGDSSGGVRAEALDGLRRSPARLSEPPVLATALRLLSDEDALVRAQAAKVAHLSRHPEARAALRKALSTEHEDSAREAILDALNPEMER